MNSSQGPSYHRAKHIFRPIWRMTRDLMSALADPCHLIARDLLGFGGSSTPPVM